jgi:hypothetical protein
MGRQQVALKANEDEDDRDDEEEETDEENEDEERDEQQDDDEDDDESGDDLDSALNDRGGKKSEYLKPWRKSGKATIWLHTKAKFAKVPHHKWFEIVQFTKRNDEDVSFVRFTRFNCHEPSDYVSISKDRDDDLRRTHCAQTCPMCKMLEWVEDQVIAGKLSPDQEIFRFDDGEPDHLQVLHAAGASGLIGLENAPERWKKICKKSRVLQKEPWNENLGLKLSHCFQVVDDSDPSGLVYAFEPPDLFFCLKDAIAKEKKREGDDKGDPRSNPYAFLWEFDQVKAQKNFGRGNEVTPLPRRKLTSQIRKLITGPKRNDQHLIVTPGNCLELRASMENAAQIDMPFDEFFAAAKKAGLMVASAQSKPAQKPKERDKQDEDGPESDPKPKTSQKARPAATTGKPAEEDEPESKPSGSDTASTCDFCDEEIGDDDFECKSCGTSFDQDNNYEINGIKCTNCGTLVPVNEGDMHDDNTSSHICPKCAAIHKLTPSVRHFYDTLNQCRKSGKRFDLKLVWTAEKKVEEKPKGRGRRSAESAANAKDSKKIDKKLNGDEIPF